MHKHRHCPGFRYSAELFATQGNAVSMVAAAGTSEPGGERTDAGGGLLALEVVADLGSGHAGADGALARGLGHRGGGAAHQEDGCCSASEQLLGK